MRTTLTLDPDVARLLQEATHRQRRPFKQVVNDALRRGMAPVPGVRAAGSFRVNPHTTTLRPGIDPGVLNRLGDELEDDAVLDKRRARP